MRIEIESSAKSDIENIAKVSRRTAAKLLAVIQAMQDYDRLNDSLLIHDLSVDLPTGELANVKKWLLLHRNKEDVWRIRLLHAEVDDLESYRVFYAFYRAGELSRFPVIKVLAVLHRSEIDYDDYESRNVRRIRSSYREPL